MRFIILPTFIDGTDEKGLPCKINICPDRAKKSVDGTKWLCHEENLPAEYKQYVINAVDRENTVTLNSGIAKGKVLATKVLALIDTVEWRAKETEAIHEL